MSLYVGNLHPDCNEADLLKKFSLIGKVMSVRVCRDWETANSLGYGYVNFFDEEDAKRAMDTMNYDILLDRNIRIMWTRRGFNTFPKSANLVVKNLDSQADEVDLKEMFSPFGEVMSIKIAKNYRGDSKGYGFVQFAEDEAADRALSSLSDAEIRGKKLSISKFILAEERRRFQQTTFPNNIYVYNITMTSNKELAKICEAFGEVVSAKIITDDKNRCRGFGFVSFKEKESAQKAVEDLNCLCLNGRRLLANFANDAG